MTEILDASLLTNDNVDQESQPERQGTFFDLTSQQCVTVFACFVSWGLDIFDSVLFNFVAPTAVPELLGLPLDTEEAIAATIEWSGILTSLLLIGWSAGGVLFGLCADRFGRTRTMQLTIAMFGVGTALCAASTSIWFLILCRLVASVGIGGEWASGASLVAESVPDKRRVEAGALLFVASPIGMFLAGGVARFVNSVVPSRMLAWRIVMLCGLAPALVALLLRFCVREPERWVRQRRRTDAVVGTVDRLKLLFARSNRIVTLTNLLLSVVILLLLWPITAFIPTIATGFAIRSSSTNANDRKQLTESYKSLINNCFTFGGVLGTIGAALIAKFVGRKAMFLVYFVGVLFVNSFVFGNPNNLLSDEAIMYLFSLLGLFVYGIAGTMTFYLPESFPTEIRATGSGLCLNAGRIVAAGGPFVVGMIASQGENAVNLAMSALFCNGFIAVLPLLSLRWIVETRGQELK